MPRAVAPKAQDSRTPLAEFKEISKYLYLKLLLWTMVAVYKSQRHLAVENVILRHQVTILRWKHNRTNGGTLPLAEAVFFRKTLPNHPSVSSVS